MVKDQIFLTTKLLRLSHIDIRQKMSEIIDPTFSVNPNGIKTYDFQKKQDMLDLITKVKNGYRIFKIAKLLMFLV